MYVCMYVYVCVCVGKYTCTNVCVRTFVYTYLCLTGNDSRSHRVE